MALQTYAANVENFEAVVLDVLTLTQTQEKKFDNPAEVVITGVYKWKKQASNVVTLLISRKKYIPQTCLTTPSSVCGS